MHPGEPPGDPSRTGSTRRVDHGGRGGERGAAAPVSMSSPLEPDLGHRDDGAPAADLGTGAPAAAPGTGIGGEEPDLVDPAEEVAAPVADGGADEPDRR